MSRIVIDATPLPMQPVGAGYYIIHLIRTLLALDTGIDWRILTHAADRPLLDLTPAQEKALVFVPDRGTGQRLLWEQTGLPRLVKDLKADLVHSLHYSMPYRAGCRSVVTFHDMTFFLYPQFHTLVKRVYFQNAIRLSARRANALIADSESTRQDAIRLLKIPPQRITTAPLGLSPDFKPCRDAGQQDLVRAKYHLPKRFILHVGTVEPRKNLPLLLRAFADLCKSDKQLALISVGRPGWMYQDIYALADQLGIKERVLFAGYVERQDMPAIFSLAEVFVYPSHYEGFGLPVLEGLACGVPVITTNVSSMPEVAGTAALLVPPNDLPALLGALRGVLSDASLRKELARQGPIQAAGFTWERTARVILEVYRKVLDG